MTVWQAVLSSNDIAAMAHGVFAAPVRGQRPLVE
jgi:hypothetical protein